jgi:hypothetical protein
MMSISYGNWISAGIFFVKDEPTILLRLPFWKKEISIIEKLAKRKPDSESNKRLKKGKSKKERSSFSKFIFQKFKIKWRELLHSFKIERMDINIDTDDYIVNAYLFPVVQYIGYRYRRPFHINFMGINKVEISMRNRIINLLYALFK